MSTSEVIGIITGTIVVGAIVMRWLIGEWSKKSEEVEKLKEEAAKRALYRLENDIKDFRLAVDKIEASMKELSADITASKLEIVSLKQELILTKKMIEDYNEKSGDQVRNMIKTEIQDLTKTLMLIRAKKNSP